jgi:chromosome segregation ATPase
MTAALESGTSERNEMQQQLDDAAAAVEAARGAAEQQLQVAKEAEELVRVLIEESKDKADNMTTELQAAVQQLHAAKEAAAQARVLLAQKQSKMDELGAELKVRCLGADSCCLSVRLQDTCSSCNRQLVCRKHAACCVNPRCVLILIRTAL